MKIKVLGTSKFSDELYESVKQAVEIGGNKAELEYINDIQKIISMGIIKTPAVLVDNRIVLSGCNPGREEVKEILSPFLFIGPWRES
ncbi:MAG: thioredoxin family protein [Candidatus Paceibacterota bacterium]|jgi:small redox-active disulfide protein 2|nr:thioredoxin family protein [Candidatus Paceibacterota bacterium]MDD4830729.1 thioredoxin family protein [Candidatus Paceibacterota bacterium]MDD4875122.1 thioredoxin family protein [Candidatus Paceibacterota bacterium]